MARWPSGQAEDCKSFHAGSIPARASNIPYTDVHQSSLKFTKALRMRGFLFVFVRDIFLPFSYSHRFWGQAVKNGGKMKLTDKAIKNAKPKDRPYKLADGGGMYLEVMPNGSKLWRIKYRYLGKETRMSLGA